jgi:hypothetical protein
VRTIPFAVVTVPPPPDDQTRSKRRKRKPLISADQWAQIERAYGHKLSAAIKRKVLRVTTSFVLFEPFARAATPSAEAEKRVQSIKKATEAFYLVLFDRPDYLKRRARELEQQLQALTRQPEEEGAKDREIRIAEIAKLKTRIANLGAGTTFAENAIDRHFKGGMPQLCPLLLSLGAACDPALAEVESSPGHREGAAWEQWIRDLTTILDAAGLPTTASKGRRKSKSDSPSSFVSFVLKLQDCVPEEARRHTTPDGLATAINRACRGLGSKAGRPSTKK